MALVKAQRIIYRFSSSSNTKRGIGNIKEYLRVVLQKDWKG